MHPALRNSLPTVASVSLLILLSFPLTAQSPTPSTPSATAAQPAAAQSAPAPQAAVSLTPAQQLAADTARLQELAAELKDAMNKSTKDTLSFTVIKKAQEVEKLAHKVRDEMRSSLLHGS